MHPNSESARATLIQSQNKDGGWGYYPGRSSWLEPTAWAFIALWNQGHADSCQRALAWMRTLQRDDGGVAPRPGVTASSWVASLWITAHCVAGHWDQGPTRALDWLLDTYGAEGARWRRWIERIRHSAGYDPRFYGWSWFPGTHSWLEPTVHSVVALKLASRHARWHAGYIAERVDLAESMLLDRRCADGAWNYGARAALGVPLPSYPECTGQALLALQGRPELPADRVRTMIARWDSVRSPMARVWLQLAARLHGIDFPPGVGNAARDLSVAALALAADADGNHKLLHTADWRRADA
jgi:hypothetical protein